MATGERTGLECKLYYDSAASYASPTWVEITKAIDVNVNVDANTATFGSRESEWEEHSLTLKTMEVTFGYEWTNGVDTVFDALLSAFLNETRTQFWIADGTSSPAASQTTEGWRAAFSVIGPTVNQPLQDGMILDFTLRPRRWDDAGYSGPEWFTVTGT